MDDDSDNYSDDTEEIELIPGERGGEGFILTKEQSFINL